LEKGCHVGGDRVSLSTRYAKSNSAILATSTFSLRAHIQYFFIAFKKNVRFLGLNNRPALLSTFKKTLVLEK